MVKLMQNRKLKFAHKAQTGLWTSVVPSFVESREFELSQINEGYREELLRGSRQDYCRLKIRNRIK